MNSREAAIVTALFLSACGRGGPGSPLIHAARTGQAAEIRALLTAGRDSNERAGVNDWPALMHAIHKGQTRAVLALLEGAADPNARGGGGSTPLIMAAGYGYADMVRRRPRACPTVGQRCIENNLARQERGKSAASFVIRREIWWRRMVGRLHHFDQER